MSVDGTRNTVEQLLGLAIVAVVLADVFLTVLYPRLGKSIVGYRLEARVDVRAAARWRPGLGDSRVPV